MEFKHINLYNSIKNFSLDETNSQLSFTSRLAKENGWSLKYARRVVEEYKRFMFLAVTAGHKVVPSDQVDQVWHLHLTYTKSYWQEFCPKILATTLHHEPTRGGLSEHLKFDSLYNQTLKSYEKFFGHIPPLDIWPTAKDRFSRDISFIRINSQQNWILPKPQWKSVFEKPLLKVWSFWILLTLSVLMTGCEVIYRIPNPINFSGPQFLSFYITVGVIGIAFASWLRFSLRLPKDGTNEQLDLNTYEMALLAGGNKHIVVTAIVSLVQQGYVEVVKGSWLGGKSQLVVKNQTDNIADTIEKKVAHTISVTNGTIQEVLQNSQNIGDSICSRLQGLGLFLRDKQASQARTYPSLIIITLLGLGLWKMFVGIAREKPVGFLIMCMFILLMMGWRLFTKPERSLYGDRILNDFKTRLQDLQTVNSNDLNFVFALALFGTTVLKGDRALGDLGEMLAPADNFSAGGGGCGGGCGGCGGCGG